MHQRKKPFSGKRKKEQLQEKRARKNEATTGIVNSQSQEKNNNKTRKPPGKKNAQNAPPPRLHHKEKQKNRLNTVFEKESQEEIDRRKLEANKPLKRDLMTQEHYYGELIDIPLRPYWEPTMTKEQVQSNEDTMFKNYLEKIYKKYPKERLNHFEHNLEVWRQLWRVCEISDILLMLADCRIPVFHFPPALYRYVVKVLKKPLVLVLTKIDLVPEKVLNQWKSYFQKSFPELLITSVRSFEVDKQEVISLDKKRRRRKRKALQIPTGTKELIIFLNSLIVERGFQPLEIPQTEENESNSDTSEDEAEESSSEGEEEELPQVPEDPGFQLEDPNKSYLTLGFIGHPNVGKSTLINKLKGRTVCSTSRTPGHTKYKQTIFLNDTVMLCDCPGLVFPAVDVPKLLQVVFGIFPIAQVREPYSSIRYIAERVPLETVYKLEKIEEDQPWTPYEICEAYAEKRGYHTQKGRADTHRAALEILRDHLDGRVVLYFTPNSSRINVGVYEEGAVDIDLNEIKEETEEMEDKNKKIKSKPVESSVEEEDEEEDEESSDATSNPFSVLDDD